MRERGGDGTDGDQHQNGAPAHSIVGGHLDTTTKGVVALTVDAHDQFGVICSGSLLAPNLVLTARHCVLELVTARARRGAIATRAKFTANYDPRRLFVSTDARPQGTGGELYAIKEIFGAPGGRGDVCGLIFALVVPSGSGIPRVRSQTD